MTQAPSPTPFESLLARILAAGPSVPRIAAALGGPSSATDDADVTFTLSAAPFVAVTLSPFRGSVNCRFTLGPGEWTVGRLVADPAAWDTGPPLDGLGGWEAGREWTAGEVFVTGILPVDGPPPLAARRVTGAPRCQVGRF